jgi:glycosyltransferase involved in cell wall biosynthesis
MTLTVLHVLEALSSGTSRHVVDLVTHAEGVVHHVAVPAERSVGGTDWIAFEHLRAAGAHVHVVDMHRSAFSPQNVRALGALTVLARRVRPDVVHGHSGVGGALTRALPVRAPLVYTPHGLAPYRAALLIERLLGVRTSRLVLVSESERTAARALRLVPESRMTVIVNGIDLAPPAPVDLHALLGLPSSTPLVGTVGRLAPQKAPLDFVAVCRRLARRTADAHFVMVGDGVLAGDVDRAAAPLGARWHRIPALPSAAAALGSLTVFVLMSRYEGGPYAPLEAARAGVPLVLTDVVGNRDVCVEGGSGVLVSAGDLDAVASQVLRLLGDESARTGLVDAMAARLRDNFDVRSQGRAHRDLYVALATRHPTS